MSSLAHVRSEVEPVGQKLTGTRRFAWEQIKEDIQQLCGAELHVQEWVEGGVHRVEGASDRGSR